MPFSRYWIVMWVIISSHRIVKEIFWPQDNRIDKVRSTHPVFVFESLYFYQGREIWFANLSISLYPILQAGDKKRLPGVKSSGNY